MRLDKTTHGRRGETVQIWAVCGLLLLGVACVYGQTARHDFVNFDDHEYVFKNRHVLKGLTRDGIVHAFLPDVSAQWQPLTMLSLLLDAQLVRPGTTPQGLARLAAAMHVENAALHAANAVLLFLVLRAMTASLWRSALVAALFAVHPLHVESVAWITERKDVLSGLFGLLALAAYVGYVGRPSVARYLGVAAALCLGLMAKPMLVTWPALFLVLDYWPLGRAGSRGRGAGSKEQGAGSRASMSRLVLEKLPLFGLVAASAAAAFLAQHYAGAVVPLELAPLSARLARCAVLYGTYVCRTFWPAGLALYPVEQFNSYGLALAAWVLLSLLTVTLVWRGQRGRPWLIVGWLWFLGTLVPTIGLVQVGSQVLADRFVYLPQIGLGILVVWAVAEAALQWRHVTLPLAAASAIVLAALTVCAWRQTSHWRDGETLWRHALACNSSNMLARVNLGGFFDQHHEYETAIAVYRDALEVTPNDTAIRNSLGKDLAELGRIDEALAEYRAALEINPQFEACYNNIGVTLAGRGRLDEAMQHYRTALDLNPKYMQAHYNLGSALASQGKQNEAIGHYRKAIEIDPDYTQAHSDLGRALAAVGQGDEAEAEYRRALEIDPQYVEAYNNLGNALGRRGLYAEAIVQYRQALEIKPGYDLAHRNLGAALAAMGQFDEAIENYRRALEINAGFMDARIDLGDALAARGQIAEALAEYRKALASATARGNKALVQEIEAKLKQFR